MVVDSQKKLVKFVKSYAKRQHLVNLGDVTSSDSHSPIGGFLFQPKHQDYSYSQGHVQGLDVSIAVRSVSLPGFNELITRIVIEVSLDAEYPHIIALGDEHDESYFKALLARYHHYSRNDFGPWKLFAEAAEYPEVEHLRDLLLSLHEYGVADVEIEGRLIRLYLSDKHSEEDIDNSINAIRDLFQVN